MRTWLAALLLVALLPLCAAGRVDKNAPGLRTGEPYYEYAPGEVLVKFSALTAGLRVADVCAAIGAQPVMYDPALDYYQVALSAAGGEAAAVEYFRRQSGVEWANFNYIGRALFQPNDTFYPYQWHLPRMNLEAAWDLTRGAAGVVIAVCDMGYYFNHTDWGGVLTTNPRDVINNDDDPSTTVFDSHGAHVAGTIFAATNNNRGVAGVAPLCTLMPVRCLDDSGSGTVAQIASGVSWATTHNADVINLSLGFTVSGPPQDPGPPLSTAIAQAANAGIVIVAATGNDGANYVGYPAAYTQCIAVGATGWDDAIAPYSNRGSAIDVVAPGGNLAQDLNNDDYGDGVLSTVRNGQGDNYSFWQGTSMATPHVAGVAGLLLARGLAAAQVRQALQETAHDLGANGFDVTYGYGRIDALAALQWGGGSSEVTLLQEGFDGSAWPPAGWELDQTGESNPEGWERLAGNGDAAGGTTPHGGSNAAFHDDDDIPGPDAEAIDWLVTPQITIPAGATAAELVFWQRNYWLPDYYQGETYHGVLYSTDNTNFNELIELGTRQETWDEVTLDVSGLAGQSVYIAFLYVGDYATEWYVDDVRLTARVSGDTEEVTQALPREIRLGEAYPNPFNSTATIPLELPAAARVDLAIYNTLGQRVTTLVNSALMGAGVHRITWQADGAATGLYFARLTSGSVVQTKKLMLVK